MRTVIRGVTLTLVLAGCSVPASHPPETAVCGRYTGIGTYSPGELWSRMTVAKTPKAPEAATTADDEHVIVVVDSQSGEVRERGDYSGVCITMNPWTGLVSKEQASPITLTKHLAAIQQEQKSVERDGSSKH